MAPHVGASGVSCPPFGSGNSPSFHPKLSSCYSPGLCGLSCTHSFFPVSCSAGYLLYHCVSPLSLHQGLCVPRCLMLGLCLYGRHSLLPPSPVHYVHHRHVALDIPLGCFLADCILRFCLQPCGFSPDRLAPSFCLPGCFGGVRRGPGNNSARFASMVGCACCFGRWGRYCGTG